MMKTKLKNYLKANRHAYALCYLAFYLAAFWLLDIFTAPKYWISCPLDKYIPFCEWFVVPYFLWFLAFPGSLLFYLWLDKEDFVRLCWVMFGGSTVTFLIYFCFPTGLNLRPEVIGDNWACQLLRLVWAVDAPNNVCPSLHVSISAAIALVTWQSKKLTAHRLFRQSVVFLMALICLSTMFVKQHSIIDVAAGLLLSVGCFALYESALGETGKGFWHKRNKKCFDSLSRPWGIIKMKGDE